MLFTISRSSLELVTPTLFTALDAIKAVRAAVENKRPLLGFSQIHNNKLAIPRPQVALSKFEESFNPRQDL